MAWLHFVTTALGFLKVQIQKKWINWFWKKIRIERKYTKNMHVPR